MPNRLTFVSLSDVRGDMDFLSKAIALAVSRDVQAQGIFLLGNLAGPLLSKPEYLQLDAARRTLTFELKAHDSHYRELGIMSVWSLMTHMGRFPDRYRRGAEVSAVGCYRQLLGRRDETGKFAELGTGARKAKAVYAQIAKAFSRARVPCYLMADTVFAEELPEEQWLHFSWVSLAGFSIRCLGAAEIDDREAVPEFFVGPRRGGRFVRIEGYPFSSADIIFAYVLSPVLHEVPSTHEKKLVIMCGDGQIDTGYPRNIVATQRTSMLYQYIVDGTKVIRKSYEYAAGAFKPPTTEDGTETSSTTRFVRKGGIKRAEIETQVRLAGLGSDLVKFIDLLKHEDPALAAQMEKAENRAEAIFRYIQYLEGQRQALRGQLSSESAGFERLLGKLCPYLGDEGTARINEAIRARPDVSAGVEARDGANEQISELVSRLVAQRLGVPQIASIAALPAQPAPAPAVEPPAPVPVAEPPAAPPL